MPVTDILAGLDVWQALATIVKAATYSTSLAAAGGVMFIAVFGRQLPLPELQATSRFIVNVSWSAVVLSLFRIAILNAILGDGLATLTDWSLTRTVMESSEGLATSLREAGLVTIAASLRGNLKIATPYFALTGAVAAAGSFALVGHAGEVALRPGFALLPQSLFLAHLLAVAFWLGSLWPLHRLARHGELKVVAPVMHRFGQIAVAAVILLVAAGGLLIWLILGDWDALWHSAYGRLLLVKLLLVATLLALAALNKLRLTPRLRCGDQSALKTLKNSILGEVVIASLILVTTASFTTLVGPPEH